MADTVYEMMAKIGLDSRLLEAGLLAIGIKLKALHFNVEALGLALKGLGSALAVVAIVEGFEKIAKAGGAVNHEINMMKSIGMTNSEQAAAIAQAQQTAINVPTTHFSENLKHLQELRYIMGDATTANQYIDRLSRINDTIGNINGKNKDQIFDLAKSLEMKNLTPDPKEFMAYADAMLQVIQSSGGKITAAMFRSAVQYGRVSALGWDKDFITGALGRMIQEYSASGGSGGGSGGGQGGPGNALMSMSQAVISGKMTKRSAEAWEDLGFNYPRFTGIDKEHGRDLMMTNPYEWVQKFLMPAMAAKGITDQNAIISKISELFGVRTAAGIVANMALGGSFHVPGVNAEGKPNSPFEKDIGLQKIAEGENAYDRLVKQDYPMIMKAFNAQWKELLETIGSELMAPGGPVIRAMAGMVTGLTEINKFFIEHPKMIDALLIAAAGLAAAFASLAVGAVVGVMAMLAPGGLIVVAIAGLVAALSTMAALNWDKVKAIADGISYITSTLGAAMSMLGMNPFRDSKKLPSSNVDPKYLPQNFEGVGPTGPKIIPASLNGITTPVTTSPDFKIYSPTTNLKLEGGSQSLLPDNFNPSTNKQINFRHETTMNVDGRTLAQVISDVLEDLYEHPTGSPSPDGLGQFRPQGNFSST